MEVAPQLLLLIDHPGELPGGEAVPHRHRAAAHEAAVGVLQDAPLHHAAPQGIGAVQHHQPLPGGGAVLHHIAQGGHEGIEPQAHVLDVVHQDVEGVQHMPAQPLPLRAVEAEHRQARGRVRVVPGEGPGGLIAPHAVLGPQQGRQVTHAAQDVDGGLIPAAAAGNGRQQGHPTVLQQSGVLRDMVYAIGYHGSLPLL